jgi:outer membrane immunogenic protein
MAARTLGTIAAIGILAAIPAQADPIAGDIVDQILQSQSAPPSPAVVAPAPLPPTAMAEPTTLDSPDIVDQRLQATPVALTAPVPPPTPAPAPVSAPVPVSASAPTPAPEPVNVVNIAPWTGVYLGGNLGGGWTHGGSSVGCVNTATGTSSGCDIINDGALSTSGVLGGGQLGYLRPLVLGSGTPLVVGAEIDIQGTGMSGSQSVAGPFHLVGFPDTCSPCGFTASQKIDWFGTLRARVGVPVDNFLIYVTGGLMVGGVKASQNLSFTGTGQGEAINAKSTLSGPTVGGGVEMLLGGPWSAKLEALYYDMGTLNTIASSYGHAPTNFNDSKSFGFSGAMIRLGVNLRLGDLGLF